MKKPLPPEPLILERLNKTQLLELVRKECGVRLRRAVARPRIFEILLGRKTPQPDEVSGTAESRTLLEAVIQQQSWIQEQMPCTGEHRCHCTIYPCTDGQHLTCYLAAAASKHLDV